MRPSRESVDGNGGDVGSVVDDAAGDEGDGAGDDDAATPEDRIDAVA
jgi:hypothetical protein